MSTRPALQELEDAVGWVAPERCDVIERRHLRFYREAIGAAPTDDPTAVPATLCACFLHEPPLLPAASSYGAGWLNGGDRFEYHAALRLGDELRSAQRFTGVTEKRGRAGPMAILTFVTEFRHADGELAVRHVGTRIRR